MRAALALVRKDLAIFFADRRSVVMSFAAPIVIGSFFGFLFSGPVDAARTRVAVRIVDQDGSALSRRLTAAVAADPSLQLQEPVDEAAAREAVRRGSTTVALVLPPGFGSSAAEAFFAAGTRPAIVVLYDPSHGAELAMVRGLLTEHLMQALNTEVFAGEQGAALTRRSLERLRQGSGLPEAERTALADMLESVDRWYRRPAARAGAGGDATPFGVPVEMRSEAVTSRAGVAYNSYAHSFAGMGVQFLLFACIDLGVALLAERRLGIWKRMRAAPLSRASLVAGKTLSGAAVALLTLLVTFGFAMAVWGVRVQGSWPGFLLVCGATALMASTFGLLVASIGRTPEAARGVAILASLVMVMLGGAWVPAFVFPGWLQAATLVVPARWAVDGLDAATWRGVGFAGLMPAVGALVAFAALFGGLAVARFRWDPD